MSWQVDVCEEFLQEYGQLPDAVQDELIAQLYLLRAVGPDLGRPHVDTLKGSTHANMKELRFDVGRNVWRVAFAFDPLRKAILLVGGSKSGVSQARFYRKLIKLADERFDRHLVDLKEGNT